MKILLTFLILSIFLLTACGTPVVEPQDGAYLQYEVDHDTHNPTTSMMTFEVGDEKVDLFDKWEKRQARDEYQEEYEAFIDENDCAYERCY